MQDVYEKLGIFYLGKTFDPASGKTVDPLLLYESKDLTTHAVCVGMTGSGKTGLCLGLLEEAAIDGIPAIAIDPKGDLGNLLLNFPQLQPHDFQPWVDPAEAARQGETVEALAAKTADLWRNGLAEWQQDGARIQKLRDAADIAIYTPGSSAGLPITVLRSFAAPSQAVLADGDALSDRIASAAGSLLALLKIDADPIRSREHILLANIFDRAWRAGRDLSLQQLIHEIQTPPFEQVGVVSLENFFPAKDRFELAMRLNNLLASPGFNSWLEGEPLDIQRLLYTPEGKPRLSIMSIAHLSESERMFFVTLLLSEMIAWMRAQPGTSSLRAVLYMDEVFGYFPPTANPPSKTPMLTLLKQARAYGVGVVLATQNPVDLDYKGLSNAGTWLLGRLQTERDKARVLDGLEGASAASGKGFNRAEMDKLLSGLGKRVFLLNNVHDDAPTLFQTRWTLSYLRGPLTREQIGTLMAPRKQQQVANGNGKTFSHTAAALGMRPVLSPSIEQAFIARCRAVADDQQVVYVPTIAGFAKVRYAQRRGNVEVWRDELYKIGELAAGNVAWESAERLGEPFEVDDGPERDACFEALPAELADAKQFAALARGLKDYLYRHVRLKLFECAELKEFSSPDETEGDFRIRIRDKSHERRDELIEKLRAKYAPKLAMLEERLRKAEQRLEKQKAASQQGYISAALSMLATVVGAIFGRKLQSATNVNRATSSARAASRAMSKRGDVAHAEETVEAVQEQLEDLDAELKNEIAKVSSAEPEITPLEIAPTKTGIQVDRVVLAWEPWLAKDGQPIRPAT